MRSNPRSGILSLVLAEIKDGAPDPRVIEEFRGFELMTDLPDQYPVVFSMTSDALEFAVHLGCKFRDQMKVVVITKQMELTGDRFDGSPLMLATSILGKTNPGRVMVSAASLEMLDEDLDRDYSLLPTGRLDLDDGRGVSMFKVLHSGFPTDHTADFIKELTNLPRWGGRFVGRKKELLDIGERMLMARSVVLIGATGVGKSRLVIEFGNHILSEQPGGVWYVDLRYAPQNQRLLEDHVAKKLKLKGSFDLSPMERICEFLQARGTTLILDACEAAPQVIASFAEDLLLQCPHLQIILGTQQALPLTSVAIYRVPPMRGEPGEGKLSDAVELFVARAELYDEHFEPSARDLEEIAALCENLAGVPLAIELAAAAYVNQGQIATTRGTDRSATNNVLAWIAKNLNRTETRLAEACAFFRGPIELELIRKLAPETTDKDIRTLLNWAVLRIDGEQNIRMPRGVQAFFGNVSKARRRELAEAHAACFTAACLDWEAQKRLDLFARYSDDCQEALSWSCKNLQSQRVMDLVYSLFDAWFGFGRFDEGLGSCERALEACSGDELMLARIYNMMCGLARGKADMEASIAYADLGIALAVKIKEKPILTRLYLQAGSALWAIQEYERGLAAFAECRKCSKSLGLDYGILLCDLYSASLRAEKGESKKAESAFAKLRSQVLPPDIKTILDLHEGAYRLMEDQLMEARELLEKSFLAFHEEGNTVGCMSSMRMLVPCLAKSGLAYIAAWIDGMLDRLNQEVHLYWHEPQRVLYLSSLAEIRRTLGPGVYFDQFEHGQYTTLDAFKKFLTKETFLTDLEEPQD